MTIHRAVSIRFGGALSLATMTMEVVLAASSFSNSLTTFTGESTLVATQTAVAIAGFNFFNTTAGDGFTSNPTVVFDANGATFGKYLGGDGGRNYVRTATSDYATVSFVAEITITVGADESLTNQQLFFGMGSGNTALYGIPDWSTQFASTFVEPQVNGVGNSFFTTFRTQNDANEFVEFTENGYTDGTHRLRMTFDKSARTMTYAIDLHFVGGTFVPDITLRPVDLNHIDCPSGCGDPMMPISADFFGPDGWPTEPSRLYFGGDDGVTFRDFSVVVSALTGVSGDYNQNGTVDAADYTLWRDHLGQTFTLTNKNPAAATPGIVDQEDYDFWKSHFGDMAGSGSGANATSTVPEPMSLALLMLTAAGWSVRRGRVK